MLLCFGLLAGASAQAGFEVDALYSKPASSRTEFVIGRPEAVDSTTPVTDWIVDQRGVLNIVDGGRALKVEASNSRVFIDHGGVEAGLTLKDSTAEIRHGTLTNSNSYGLLLNTHVGTVNPGSTAVLYDSTVRGRNAGISAGAHGSLSVYRTDVYGAAGQLWGAGIKLSGAEVLIADNSNVVGELNGLVVLEGLSGHGPYAVDPHFNNVEIDSSTIQGLQGAAIRVDWTYRPATAEIYLRNGTELLSGNGNLVEVVKRSKLDFTVDDSRLTGNLFADDTSTLNVTLQNNAQLTGNIINGNWLALASGGYWQMTGDNSLKTLNMDGGAVGFGDGAFKTLSLNELSGHGNFAMRVDLDHGIGDLLNVNGQANGQFGLRVQNTGHEVVSPDLQPLRVVHTEGGSAQFNLIGDRVDLGVYSYGLEQQGNDWFIVGEDKTISPSTGSALALFNAAPVVWMGELSTLRSRMGEVRGTGLGGGWMRAYGNRFEASTSNGIDYRHQQQGFSLGADVPVPVGNGQLSLGVMAGHSQSDLDLSRGSSGTIDSVYVGTYGTWLSEQGYYLDAVLKLNRLRNKAKVAMSDSTRAKGDYANTAVGASLEFGRQIRLADGWFVEPYTQLAMVDVQGEGYQLDNGLRADNSHTRSVLAKAGASLGRDIALKDGGVLQPYVRLAAAQEFSHNNEVKVNDRHFDNDLSGSRMEVGAGVSVALSERLQLHADFDYMNGKRVEQPWGANVGLRFAF